MAHFRASPALPVMSVLLVLVASHTVVGLVTKAFKAPVEARDLPQRSRVSPVTSRSRRQLEGTFSVEMPSEWNVGRKKDVARTPPLGWNSWNHFGCSVNESIIRATADIIVSSGLADAGYKYVNIDDCWQEKSRDAQGRLMPSREAFPSGIKALADYVHSKGLKLGIYSDAGMFTCEGRPASLGNEAIDAATFAEWEVDYLKYDNCFSGELPIEKRYRAMRDALENTGREIFYSMCEWGLKDPATWAFDVADSWRTTFDISDTWSSMLQIADANNQWAKYAQPGGWNDPDMLEVGNGGMTTSEYRVHFSLWAMMKAPLLIGCDLQKMSEEAREILSNKEVIAINQDSLGVQARKVFATEDLEVWSGPLFGSKLVVAMVNRGTTNGTITATWSLIGLNPLQPMHVRDLWKGRTMDSVFVGDLTAIVPPHDVVMVTIWPASAL